MIEILKSFEQAAAGRFSPMVLLAPGLVMVAVGLMAWLGGMGLRRLVLALVGGAAAGTAGLLAGGLPLSVIALAAGVSAVFSAAAPRLATAVFLAGFGLVVALALVAKSQPTAGPGTLLGKPDAGPAQQRLLTTQESLDVTRACALDVVDRAVAVVRGLTLREGAVLAAVGLGLLALGLSLERLAGAMLCSVLGTALIAGGLIVLLIFKGSAPIGLVQQRGAVYGLVLLGMAGFGTLEQLVLCPPPRRRTKDEGRDPGTRGQESKAHWRGR